MQIISKNILTIESGIIAHQVNCMGVMGAGLAKTIRYKWPQVYTEYLSMCNAAEVNRPSLLGSVQQVHVQRGITVCNCFCQITVGRDKRQTHYGAFAQALIRLDSIYHYRRSVGDYISKIHIPYGMGCGLAGGDWNVVSELIEALCPDAIICKL